jgi:hypothetical protein
MSSPKRLAALVVVFVFAFPAQALAATGQSTIIPEWLDMAVAGVGLITAVVLLLDAVQLRKVASGSAVAENITYMILAVVCLAGSMLLRWVVAFMDDIDMAAQMRFTADLLVIAGMALLAVYFYRVRYALQRYLEVLSGSLGSTPSAEESDPDQPATAAGQSDEGADG